MARLSCLIALGLAGFLAGCSTTGRNVELERRCGQPNYADIAEAANGRDTPYTRCQRVFERNAAAGKASRP